VTLPFYKGSGLLIRWDVCRVQRGSIHEHGIGISLRGFAEVQRVLRDQRLSAFHKSVAKLQVVGKKANLSDLKKKGAARQPA
jgi:hypothetical protein